MPAQHYEVCQPLLINDGVHQPNPTSMCTVCVAVLWLMEWIVLWKAHWEACLPGCQLLVLALVQSAAGSDCGSES